VRSWISDRSSSASIPNHLPHGPTCGRGRVNGFRQGSEGHVARFEVIEQRDQVTQRPAQAVQFPDNQHVTRVQRRKAPGQLWPLDVSASSLVGVDLLAPGPLQGGELQVRVLVIRGDATIADVHAAILTTISDACNSLFFQA
jgi:hypothetical protein